MKYPPNVTYIYNIDPKTYKFAKQTYVFVPYYKNEYPEWINKFNHFPRICRTISQKKEIKELGNIYITQKYLVIGQVGDKNDIEQQHIAFMMCLDKFKFVWRDIIFYKEGLSEDEKGFELYESLIDDFARSHHYAKITVISSKKKPCIFNIVDNSSSPIYDIKYNLGDWDIFFKDILLLDIFIFLDEENEKNITVYPERENIFKAFELCPLKSMKCVILGMDPYPSGQATGLAFSVNKKPFPQSLKNIFKELKSDLNIESKCEETGSLNSWAQQGVLLINSALTVRQGEPDSHMKIWEDFTQSLLYFINVYKEHLVIILWGAKAKRFKNIFSLSKHKIIESAHPSPLSASKGFFGSKPFSKANEYLQGMNMKPIKW